MEALIAGSTDFTATSQGGNMRFTEEDYCVETYISMTYVILLYDVCHREVIDDAALKILLSFLLSLHDGATRMSNLWHTPQRSPKVKKHVF
jgi:hypothetical protein